MRDEEQEFFICIFDRPFEVVLPKLGGLMGSFGLLDEVEDKFSGNAFAREFFQVDYQAGEQVPAPVQLGDVAKAHGPAAAFLNTETKYRLLRVEPEDKFCVFETSVPIPDMLGHRDLIGEFCGAQFITFRYAEYEGKPSLICFTVKDSTRTIRHVAAFQDEVGDQGRTKWRFDQIGEVQPWEDELNYDARLVRDRLSRDILVEYLERFGLNFERHSDRTFHRIVEFSDRKPGLSLEAYHEEAMHVRSVLRRDLEDLQAGIYPGAEF